MGVWDMASEAAHKIPRLRRPPSGSGQTLSTTQVLHGKPRNRIIAFDASRQQYDMLSSTPPIATLPRPSITNSRNHEKRPAAVSKPPSSPSHSCFVLLEGRLRRQTPQAKSLKITIAQKKNQCWIPARQASRRYRRPRRAPREPAR